MQIRSEIAYDKQNSLPGDKREIEPKARGIALAYYHRYTTDPESVKALPNGEAWLASIERVDENIRYLSVHRGLNLDISNGQEVDHGDMQTHCRAEPERLLWGDIVEKLDRHGF